MPSLDSPPCTMLRQHNTYILSLCCCCCATLWHTMAHLRPAYIETSPRYAVNGQPDTNPALIAAMNTMFSVYLPKVTA